MPSFSFMVMTSVFDTLNSVTSSLLKYETTVAYVVLSLFELLSSPDTVKITMPITIR